MLLLAFFLSFFLSSCRDNKRTEFGQLRRFDLTEIQLATDNFSNNNVIGRGGLGNVYRGLLADNTKIVVKRLKHERFADGELQFQTEVEINSVAVHRNIMRLIGFCTTKTERILVYPFMHNISVSHQLRDILPGENVLNWSRRKQVALGTARALEYLHEHNHPKIIHNGVKAANILLDDNFEAFLGDFGLAELVHVEDTQNYFIKSTGKLSIKVDVFSYGLFLLELITGQLASDRSRLEKDQDESMMLDYVRTFSKFTTVSINLLKVKKLLNEYRYMEIVDPIIQREYNIELEVEMMIQLALLCAQSLAEDRPVMSEVVLVLKGQRLPEMWNNWRQVKVSTKLSDIRIPED